MWERPLRLLFLRPYRCRDCEHRQYDFIWRQKATTRRQSHSLSESQFLPDTPHTTAGAAQIGNRKKWMLYGLLSCLLTGAIVSMKFGNTGLIRRSVNAARSLLIPLANRVSNESSEHGAPSVKSSQVKPPQETSAAAAKAPASVQLLERRSTVSGNEDAKNSSSAEAVRAPRPKLPANIRSKITSNNTVAVRVRIDKQGRVVGATAESTSGPVATSLVRYALATARRWRFRPARQNGKPVRSEIVLEFLFGSSDSVVSRVEDPGK